MLTIVVWHGRGRELPENCSYSSEPGEGKFHTIETVIVSSACSPQAWTLIRCTVINNLIIYITGASLQARNLVYMVQRRERLKKQLLMVQSERLHLEATEPMEEGTTGGRTSRESSTVPTATGPAAASGVDVRSRRQSRSTSHRGSSSDTDEEVTVRKTR